MRASTHPEKGDAILWVLLAIMGIVLVYAVLSYLQIKSLRRASIAELRSMYNGWIQEGRPTGDPLKKYMEGRNKAIVPANRVIPVSGTNYVTAFAMEPKSGEMGTLFVTTNGQFVWVKQSRPPKIVDLKGF